MNITDELHMIFGPFADPGTSLEITEAGASVRMRIVCYGEERDYLIDKNNKVKARHDQNRLYANFKSLIASDKFADLKGMAAMQKTILKDIDNQPSLPPMDVDGKLNDESLQTDADCLEHIAKKYLHEEGKIKIILLDGPAGVGKTFFITKQVLHRAKQYSLGGALPPLLHVTSRGRRLSNLQDVLAGAIQMVRAKFTFDQVPVLVRLGLLQLAIDGFDELVDADGYQDAWYALRDVLDDIGSSGLCILAGRDTFFDQQGFSNRLEKSHGKKINLAPVHLRPVSLETAKKWLIKRE